MATPTVREVVQNSVSGAGVTVTTGTGTQVGDYLVCIHGCDFGTLAGMTTPTGTSGTWTEQTSADLGANTIHMKLWTRVVASGGAQTVTVPDQGFGEENFQFTYVVAGVNALDGAAGTTDGAGTSATAPSVSPTGTDDLLLCAWFTANNVVNFTAPGSMTNLLEEETAGFVTLGTAREVLAAAGATGTRVATSAPACSGFTGVSLALKGSAAAAGTSLPPLSYLGARRRLIVR